MNKHAETNRTASVVIVGAGLMGCSIAYTLAKRNIKNVVVLEKKTVGSGATGKSSGVLRCHYGIPVLAHMANRSLEVFKNAEDLFGASLGYERTGYIVGVGPENHHALQSNTEMLRNLGINTSMVSPKDVHDSHPDIRTDDIAAFAFEPDGGYADPSLTVQVYATEARNLGVSIEQGHQVIQLIASENSSKIIGVKTEREMIYAPTVVIAAGVWSRPLAAAIGMDVPVQPQLERLLFINPGRLASPIPVVSDLVNLQYIRPERNGHLLIGNSDHTSPEFVSPDDYDRKIGPEYTEKSATRFLKRFPSLEQASLVTGYTGAYEVTPDYNPIMSSTPVDGLFVCTGFSGHGFKLTPVVGELMSDLVLEGGSRDKFVDLSVFRLSRFSDSDLLVSEHRYEGAGQLR